MEAAASDTQLTTSLASVNSNHSLRVKYNGSRARAQGPFAWQSSRLVTNVDQHLPEQAKIVPFLSRTAITYLRTVLANESCSEWPVTGALCPNRLWGPQGKYQKLYVMSEIVIYDTSLTNMVKQCRFLQQQQHGLATGLAAECGWYF